MELQAQGKLRMVGLIQEQHPERCRLFMQWKGMDWPVMVDGLNLLGVSVVPITLLIDEHGIIRARNPRGARALQEFLDTTYDPAPAQPAAPPVPPDLDLLRRGTAAGGAAAWRAYAEALFLWGGAGRIGESVAAFREALELEPGDPAGWFRLGVALRRRHESPDRRPDDFQEAVRAWGRALDGEPNQYIWRRRIQQYGPRLDKPYPFYDWVARARQEIAARGETPAALPVAPGGAELAQPARTFETVSGERRSPDPGGRIRRDDGRFVKVETAVVPARVEPGGTARVHVVLRPNEANRSHWNNEAHDLVLWVDAPEGMSVDDPHRTVPSPDTEVSQEPRTVEFEVRLPEGVPGDAAALEAYALYYVCEDVDGTCLYRRQDIPIRIPLR